VKSNRYKPIDGEKR